MQPKTEREDKQDKSEFLSALRWGLLLGVGILVIVVPPRRTAQAPRQPAPPAVVQAPAAPVAPPPVAAAPQPAPLPQEAPQEPAVAKAPEQPAAPPAAGVKLADFAGEDPSPRRGTSPTGPSIRRTTSATLS
ncbi:hypothetical protein HK414_20025 [Ramlibacter terrae]|uniref:SPOR domain-containing protein n=1 Tax=Ramlibacter terrae TaxID=2732511 RepID=A0ABX6NZG7_9BURK|nr:hypothetical protein HK414_20025 [Ramlibacter terrae]